jgi:hypothetical protein
MFPPMQHDPFLYLLNRTVLKAAGYNLYYGALKRDPKIGVPNLSRDEFWRWQLEQTTGFYFGNFAYSSEYGQNLRTSRAIAERTTCG